MRYFANRRTAGFDEPAASDNGLDGEGLPLLGRAAIFATALAVMVMGTPSGIAAAVFVVWCYPHWFAWCKSREERRDCVLPFTGRNGA